MLVVVILIGFVAFTGAPYVPSRRPDIARLFKELYLLSARDVVVDIGSGDGVVLREVSKLGAQAVGYEIHPILVGVSRFISRHDDHVRVKLANFWWAPLPSNVTVVYTFGDARDIRKMYDRVQSEATRLARNLVFISYAFSVPRVEANKMNNSYYLYIVKPLQES